MSTLAALQQGFARHVRDPERHPAPADVEPRRLRIYSDLVYNTVEGLLASGFPVLRGVLGDTAWPALVREFIATHRCQTPYFLRVAGEFLDFVGSRAREPALPPFAAELAHYEWVELALDVADEEAPVFEPGADLLAGVPVLSTLAWPLAYAWPVHRIGPSYQPAEPPDLPTCLLVYRTGEDTIRFAELNVPTLRLVELLAAGELSGQAALAALAAEFPAAGAEFSAEAGAAALARLAALGVLGGGS